MRIVAVHNSGAFGGAERYTVDVVNGLGEAGHDVTLLCPAGCPMVERLEGSRVRVADSRMGMVVGWHAVIGPLNDPLFWVDLYANPLRLGLARRIRALHAQQPIDVLHVQFVKEKLWIGALGRELGVPVVWTAHGPLEPWMRRGVAGAVNSSEAASVAGVIGVSGATVRDMIDFGVSPDRVHLVYNGLPASDFSEGDRDGMRAELGVADDVLLVVVPARPYAGKGIDVLLHAARTLHAAQPGAFAFVIAGESRHRPVYAEQARRTGLGDSVRFIGHRGDMIDLYAAADAVCLPSFFEGLPYAISEAMAAGKPVIATKVGGVPEMVEDGASGLLVDAGDADALVRSLLTLCREPAVRARFGIRGRQIAEAKFDLKTMVAGTEEVLVTVAASQRGTRRVGRKEAAGETRE